MYQSFPHINYEPNRHCGSLSSLDLINADCLHRHILSLSENVLFRHALRVAMRPLKMATTSHNFSRDMTLTHHHHLVTSFVVGCHFCSSQVEKDMDLMWWGV